MAEELVGRTRELATLLGAIDDVAQGRGRAVLVEGESGIGKTALMRGLTRHAADVGFDVVVGAAEPLARERSFGPLVEALSIDLASPDPDRAAIARLLLDAAPAGPGALSLRPDTRFQVVDALVALVERLVTARPTLLVVDDLHWSDQSTLLALAALGRRLGPLPLGLVAAYRPAPRVAQLDRLAEILLEGGAHHLHVGPLEPEAVASLVARLAGGEPGPDLLDQALRAGGNPFFLIELVSGLREEGRLSVSRGQAELAESALPRTLQLTVLRRLHQVDDAALELLRLAAVLGTSCSLDELAAVSGRTAADLLGPVDVVVKSGVIDDVGGRLAFRHDLIRQAIYEDLPVAVRRGLHAAAARALAAAGATPSRVAAQFALGAEPGDGEAVGWLHRAAVEAAPRNPDAAVSLFDRCLDVASDDDPMRPLLLVERVEALGSAARVRDSEEAARHLLDHVADPALRLRLRRHLAGALFVQSRTPEAVDQYRLAADDAPGERERALVLAETALALLGAADHDEARRAADEARSTGERAGDVIPQCLALAVLSRVAAFRYAFDESLDLARTGMALADSAGSADAHRFQPVLFVGLALHDLDRLDEVREIVRRGRAVLATSGAVWAQPLYHGLAAFGHYRAGDLDEAATEAEAGVASGDEYDSRLAAVWCQSLIALVALQRDDLATAARAVEAAEHAWATTNALLGIDLMVLAKALVQESAGDTAGAFSTLEQWWDALAGLRLWPSCIVLGADLVRLAIATGHRDRATDAAAVMADAAAATGLASHEGAALRCRGLIDRDQTALGAAVEAYRRSPRRLEQAAAEEDAARLLGRTPGRRRRPGDRSFGWESLTVAELEVACLVADGLTSGEIAGRRGVSPRTVETQLSHVFAKLGMATRAQLAAEVVRRSG